MIKTIAPTTADTGLSKEQDPTHPRITPQIGVATRGGFRIR